MKKKIIGIVVVMLLFTPLFSISAVANDEPPLEYTMLRGGFRGATLSIKNVGDTEIVNIEWKLEYQDYIVMFTESNFTGIIDSLLPGETVEITTGPVFGRSKFMQGSLYVDLDFPGKMCGYGFWTSVAVFGPYVLLFPHNPLP